MKRRVYSNNGGSLQAVGGNQSLQAKDALFGDGIAALQSLQQGGVKRIPQGDTADLIAGIDVDSEERYSTVNKVQVDPGRMRKTMVKKAITPIRSGEGVGLQLTNGPMYIVRKIRTALAERGARGIVGLQKKFKIMDDDNSKTLTISEFKKGISECGITLTDVELQMMFSLFDRDGDKAISFEEFLSALRGEMSEKRKGLVHMAFEVLDSDGSGTIDMQDVIGKYDASKHPDVMSSRRPAGDVLREFLETFDVGGEVDGKVTPAEFENYYANISASIDDDVYFELMIRNAWHISGGEGQAANTSNRRVLVTGAEGRESVQEVKNDMGIGAKDRAAMASRLGVSAGQVGLYAGGKDGIEENPDFSKPGAAASGRMPSRLQIQVKTAGNQAPSSSSNNQKQTPAMQVNSLRAGRSERDVSVAAAVAKALISDLKEQLASRGARGFIGLQRKFKIFDDDNNKELNVYEFKKGIRECGVKLTDGEMGMLFAFFDKDKSGSISFDEFITTLRGALSEKRKSLVHMAFQVLDSDGSGTIDMQDVIGKYDASKHPDVMSGRRPAGDVLREFLETFDVGGEVDGKVTPAEFENYYANISASIDDDVYFELMIRNAWHISGGEGQAANTSNRRVLVTGADGRESVQEVKNDMGIGAKDRAAMASRLGVSAGQVGLYAGGKDGISSKAEDRVMSSTGKLPSRLQAHISNSKNVGKENKTATSNAFASAFQFQVKDAKEALKNGGANPATPEETFTLEDNGEFNVLASRAKIEAGKGALNKLKERVASQSFTCLATLHHNFSTYDTDGSKSLSFDEFYNALVCSDLDVGSTDAKTIFSYFDMDGNGALSFDEFMVSLRGTIPASRRDVIKFVFARLDTSRKGKVDLQSTVQKFNPSAHPLVRMNTRNASEVLQEFLETMNFGLEEDGFITYKEFEDYYTNLSLFIKSDVDFEAVLKGVWLSIIVPTLRRLPSKTNNAASNKTVAPSIKSKSDDDEFLSSSKRVDVFNIMADGREARAKAVGSLDVTGAFGSSANFSKTLPEKACGVSAFSAKSITPPALDAKEVNIDKNNARFINGPLAPDDIATVQSCKTKGMLAFSGKRYEEAENMYSKALSIIESARQGMRAPIEDKVIGDEAIKNLTININECRRQQGRQPLGEPEDDVW